MNAPLFRADRQALLDAGLIRPSPAYADNLTPYRGTLGPATLRLAGAPVFRDAPAPDSESLSLANWNVTGLPKLSRAGSKSIDRLSVFYRGQVES